MWAAVFAPSRLQPERTRVWIGACVAPIVRVLSAKARSGSLPWLPPHEPLFEPYEPDPKASAIGTSLPSARLQCGNALDAGCLREIGNRHLGQRPGMQGLRLPVSPT